MRLLYVLAPAFCWLAFADTAEIRGIVVDSSGKPVQGARVECGTASTLTDSEGRFRFSGVTRCRASAAHESFETVKAELVSGVDSRMTLNVAPLAQRVVVSATRSETTLEEAGVAGDVVTGEDFEQRQFPMISDVLREIPGLHTARFGRQGAQVQVFARGAQRTGTLVLLDGVPVNDPGGDLNFAHLASGAIERMEVIRGPESALFGAEAGSAVIQLFTRRGDPEHRAPHGSISYERGSFQTDRWIASLAGGSGKRIDYSLNAEQLHTVSEFPNDFYRNSTGAGNFGYRFSENTQLRGIFRAYDTIAGSPNRTAYGTIDFDANRADRDYVSSVRLDDVRGPNYLQRVSFGYHRLHDVFSDVRADGPYPVAAFLIDRGNRVYLDRLTDPLNPGPTPPGERLVLRTTRLTPGPGTSTTSRTDFDYQGTWTRSGGATIFGYDFERQAGNISGNDVDRNNHGLFVHEQHRIGQRLFFSAGARVERNSVYHTKFTPRAAVSFRLLPTTYLRFSAGRGITEPSLLQTFARDATFVGNPSLRLEKAASYDAGISHEWLGRRVRSEISAFRSSFKDLIVFVSPPAPAPGTWDNVEASWARGLEFSTHARLFRYVSVSANYTRLWTKVTKSNAPFSLSTGLGQELLRRPAHSAAGSLAIAPKRWFFQGGFCYLGERQDSDPFGVTRNPGYHDVFAGGSFRWQTHVTPFVRAENLLNSRYQEVLGYSSLSRTIRGGVRLEW